MSQLMRRLFARLMAEEPGGDGGGGGADPAPTADPVTPTADPTPPADPAKPADPPADPAKPPVDPAKTDEPEKFEIKIPDGFVADPELMTEFEGIAKELGIKNDGAQKIADIAPKLFAKMQAQQAEAWANQVGEWVKAAGADKEIGGANAEAAAADCGRALAAFGTPELKTMLEQYGIGNHPEMVRFGARIGKALADDKMHINGQGGGGREWADVMFGETTPKN